VGTVLAVPPTGISAQSATALSVETLPGGSLVFRNSDPSEGWTVLNVTVLAESTSLNLRLEGSRLSNVTGEPGYIAAETHLNVHPQFTHGGWSLLQLPLPAPGAETWAWDTVTIRDWTSSSSVFGLARIDFWSGDASDVPTIDAYTNLDTEQLRAAAWAGAEEGSDPTLARAVYGQGLGLPEGWYVEATRPVYYDLQYPYSSGSSRWWKSEEHSFDTVVMRALMGDNGGFALQTADPFPGSYVLDIVFQSAHKMLAVEVYNSQASANGTAYTPSVSLGGINGVKAWDWNHLQLPLWYFGGDFEEFDTIKFIDTSGDGSFFLIESLTLLSNSRDYVTAPGRTGPGITVNTSPFLADLPRDMNWVITLTDSAPSMPPGAGPPTSGIAGGPLDTGPKAIDSDQNPFLPGAKSSLPAWALAVIVSVSVLLMGMLICIFGVMFLSPMSRIKRSRSGKSQGKGPLFFVSMKEAIKETVDEVKDFVTSKRKRSANGTALVATVMRKNAGETGWASKPTSRRSSVHTPQATGVELSFADGLAADEEPDDEGEDAPLTPTAEPESWGEPQAAANTPDVNLQDLACLSADELQNILTARSEVPLQLEEADIDAEGRASGLHTLHISMNKSEASEIEQNFVDEEMKRQRGGGSGHASPEGGSPRLQSEIQRDGGRGEGSTAGARAVEEPSPRISLGPAKQVAETRAKLLNTAKDLAAARSVLEDSQRDSERSGGGTGRPGSPASNSELDAQVQLLEGVWHECMKELNSLHNAAQAGATPRSARVALASGLRSGGGSKEDIDIGFIDVNFESDVQIQGVLGTGASGVVYTGLHRGKKVAVKVLHEAEMTSTDQLRNFRAEVGVMRSLNHDNIVKFYGACMKRPHVCIIMELCSHSLFEVLHEQEKLPQYGTLLDLATDIASAMAYVHRRAVIHRDLKTHNILLSDEGRAKIVDFGIARENEKTFLDTKHAGAGTVAYMAPELFVADGIDDKVDVYSFGVILWEMLTGRVPWDHKPFPAQIVMSVAVEGARLTIPKGVPSSIRRLIRDCWRQDPRLRPSFKEILVRLKGIRQKHRIRGK
jgi:predicted Ser/Thr protein kinase